MLYVEQKQVAEVNNPLYLRRYVDISAGVDCRMGFFRFQDIQKFGKKFGLKRGSPPEAVKPPLEALKNSLYFKMSSATSRGDFSSAFDDAPCVRIVAVGATEGAAFHKKDIPQTGAVERAHGFNRMDFSERHFYAGQARNTKGVSGLSRKFFLEAFVERARYNVKLLGFCQLYEVYGVSRNAYRELRIFFGVVHGVLQDFALQDVYI